MLLGYGIAAVVVLVLLIVFNVRASSRRSPQTGNAHGNEPAESVEPAESRAALEPAAEPAKAANETLMEDNSYRSALRQFQSRPPINGGRSSSTKPSISDTDYRAALRKQKSGRKEDHE
ncbi:hypothetical protein SD71_00700 [Cohnella kolymensis]|uniref:Uncharacterized protein n=1 Tax=Cohnella kolymensis TaxID=1590652 RepID=A0ABR5A8G0_9BACL|nr:hypothetical protein [Cohnella kolymensis]KIL37266.1 hypothetical protein SD71_00700 [Cohnella kolymensis]